MQPFKILLAIIYTFIAFSITSISALMPVIDSAVLAQTLEQVAQLKAQYEELIKQTEQMGKEYSLLTSTFNGYHHFGDILKDKVLTDNLPEDWQSIYTNLRQQGINGLSPAAKQLYEQNKIYDRCKNITVLEEKRICETHAAKSTQDLAFTMELLEKSTQRMQNLQLLLDKVAETQNPKDAAELQARIAIEQSAISQDKTRLEIFKLAAAAEDNIQAEQQREANAKTWSRDKVSNPKPLTFE